MRSDCLEVRTKLKEHIMDTYPNFEDFKANAENACCAIYSSLYGEVYSMVESGCFLCYYHQVIEFIKTLNLNGTDKEYTAEQSWRLYCHLIAREGARILDKGGY